MSTVALRRTLIGLVTAAALGAGFVVSPADAAVRRLDDPRGDALAALDISAVSIRNARSVVTVTLRVPRLERRRVGGITVFVRRKVAGRPEYAASKVRRGDRWRTTWQEFGASRLPCSGLRVRLRERRVVVSIPQRCLGHNRSAVRIQASLFTRAYLRGNVPDEVVLNPTPGPTLPIDGVPSVRGTRMTPWVAHR
ncbi:hypothetical protein FE697_016590 [Mumia zhuanghuii]|uniref:Uncharacterized protein n=2 Tax=Mumia TaxID=1546255 RepID=A0ABW1QTV8_9ACTN|nr:MULTISPECIES: hypothetical protein [Mumia]KAA1420569.1 hypothetical protein FE697_016590 [Mumia zhuanghuii]